MLYHSARSRIIAFEELAIGVHGGFKSGVRPEMIRLCIDDIRADIEQAMAAA